MVPAIWGCSRRSVRGATGQVGCLKQSQKLLAQFVESDYENLRQKSRLASWAALKRKCDECGVVAPSHVTFNAAVRKRPVFEQTLKRKGRRAAYVHSAFYYELELTTPRHGDRPFEIGHIDHTQLDVEVDLLSNWPPTWPSMDDDPHRCIFPAVSCALSDLR